MRSHTAVDPARQPTAAHLSLAPAHHRSDVRSVPQFVDHLLHSRRVVTYARKSRYAKRRRRRRSATACPTFLNEVEKQPRASIYLQTRNEHRSMCIHNCCLLARVSHLGQQNSLRRHNEQRNTQQHRHPRRNGRRKHVPKKTHRQLPPSPNCSLHCTWGCSMRKPTAIPLG